MFKSDRRTLRLAIAATFLLISVPGIAQALFPEQVAGSITGRVGQRLGREQSQNAIKPTTKIVTRIDTRVQSRIRNRIDRYYNIQSTAATSIEAAGNQARRKQ